MLLYVRLDFTFLGSDDISCNHTHLRWLKGRRVEFFCYIVLYNSEAHSRSKLIGCKSKSLLYHTEYMTLIPPRHRTQRSSMDCVVCVEDKYVVHVAQGSEYMVASCSYIAYLTRKPSACICGTVHTGDKSARRHKR